MDALFVFYCSTMLCMAVFFIIDCFKNDADHSGGRVTYLSVSFVSMFIATFVTIGFLIGRRGGPWM